MRSALKTPNKSIIDYSVLVHGLGRTPLSLKFLEICLARQGFRTVNVGYPSRRFSIEQLANQLKDEVCRHCPPLNRRVHFVTHSMGGIVVRCMLKDQQFEGLGRVVMLSPPNRGSQLSERLAKNLFYRLTTGPAGQQLGPGPTGLPERLGPVDYELGVIIGDRPINPLRLLIEGENDGKVTIEEAKVKGMTDFLVVPRGHTFIMNDPTVIRQVVHFLKHGIFLKAAA